MSQSPSSTEKWWAYLFAISIIGIVAVTVALYETKELPLAIIGAMLGVAMTVFATYFLFKGQSKQQMMLLKEQHDIEREQEKDVEVFKQKLNTYNSFLNALRSYVTDKAESSKKEVIFHAMAIKMHCESSAEDALDECIINILDNTGEENEVSALVESLNKIAYIFKKELYGSAPDNSSKMIEKFAIAISGSPEEATEEQKKVQAEEDAKEDESVMNGSSIQSWSTKVADLASQGWILKNGDDSFMLASKDSPVIISVYRKKGKYVVEAKKGDDSEFSQLLKDSYGGSRRYGTWWRELPISNYGVKQDTLLAQLPVNDRARASVIKWIDKLTEYKSR